MATNQLIAVNLAYLSDIVTIAGHTAFWASGYPKCIHLAEVGKCTMSLLLAYFVTERNSKTKKFGASSMS